MKNFLKKIVLLLLKIMARHRMHKFKGKVIAVTGTIGKTSTKEAIFSVLNTKFRVLKSKGNMNTDFGLPLTILEIDSGRSSAMKWTWLLLKALAHSLSKNTNDVMLVELGVDKPKDMDYLLSLVKPEIVVLTNVSPVHIEEGKFKDLQEVFAEKRKPVDRLNKETGVAILNTDNPYLKSLAKEMKKKNVISYGTAEESDYRAGRIAQDVNTGINFRLYKDEEKIDVSVPILGEFQIYTLLPALICGNILGMTLLDCAEALKRYSLPPGRMSIIPTINKGIILDSSYNSSPEALRAALLLLKDISGGKRRIAVLGSMNELGEQSRPLHEGLGEMIPHCADILVTVGKEAKYFAQKATEKGLDEKNIFSFGTANEAANFLKDKIAPGDIILVKGSQNNVRLEHLVKALMANPEEADDLLVRQGENWD